MLKWTLFALLAALATADSQYGSAQPPAVVLPQPQVYDVPISAPFFSQSYGAPVAPAPLPSPSYGAPVVPAPLPSPSYGAPVVSAPLPSPSYGAPVVPAPLPSPSYGAPAVAPAPLSTPSQSYGAPVAPVPLPSQSYGAPIAPAPLPSPSYGVPAAPGPYGAVSQPHVTVTLVPGKLDQVGFHNAFYAPLIKSVYVPLPTTYTPPPPSTGYGVPPPAPSSSYGVPVTHSGPYGAPAPAPAYSAPAPQFAIHRKKIGDAAVNSWLSQTVLQGGGKITETKVKDGYNGYKTIVNEEWQDQKPYYNYGYDIKSKLGYGASPYDELNTSASESRHGYQTIGRYSVKQPDGRTRIVEYTADANGFRPVVTYV